MMKLRDISETNAMPLGQLNLSSISRVPAVAGSQET
jgi:hypothetical protein